MSLTNRAEPCDEEHRKPLTYAQAGVDIDAQDEAIRKLAPHARSTFNANVLTDVGLFGAAFKASFEGMTEPVLISSTDGVGTKLKYTARFGAYRNAGIDVVSTCINDIICAGATPLFFLDYIGIHKVVPEIVEELVDGMADGCRQAGCALIGGEIAEMPDIYSAGEFDLVGFAVGVVDRACMLPRRNIVEGDVIIGIPSSGIHCNGFTLVRKVFSEIPDEAWHELDDELDSSLAGEVTRPARIYAREARALLESGSIKALAHISGGGLLDNIPRVLPAGFGASIDRSVLIVPPVFGRISIIGNVKQREMFRVFNMGIGFAAVVPACEAESCLELLASLGSQAYIIGAITGGSGVKLL